MAIRLGLSGVGVTVGLININLGGELLAHSINLVARGTSLPAPRSAVRWAKSGRGCRQQSIAGDRCGQRGCAVQRPTPDSCVAAPLERHRKVRHSHRWALTEYGSQELSAGWCAGGRAV